jgi:hypothetical protein
MRICLIAAFIVYIGCCASASGWKNRSCCAAQRDKLTCEVKAGRGYRWYRRYGNDQHRVGQGGAIGVERTIRSEYPTALSLRFAGNSSMPALMSVTSDTLAILLSRSDVVNLIPIKAGFWEH